MDQRSLGILLMILATALGLLGLLIFVGGLSWFGKLPGDLHFEGDHSRVVIPITSMVILSLALTLLVNLFRRLL